MTHCFGHYLSFHSFHHVSLASQTSDLSVVFKESSPSTPLIFVLSPGTDPAADLYKFAEVMRFSKKMNAISLGQGQVRTYSRTSRNKETYAQTDITVVASD